MTLIKFSASESRRLGLKVGHLATSHLSGPRFAEALMEGRYDLCRLKVRTDECVDSAVAALEEAGFPYFYAGGILRYERDYRDRPYELRYERPEGLEFVAVDRESERALEDLVRRCFREDPIGYYKTPYLRAIFSREAEVDCLVDYYLRGENPDRKKLLVMHRGACVGFLVLTEIDGVLHTELSGVAPDFRSCGFFNPIRDYAHMRASSQSLREEEGARIHNLQNQNIFEEDGLEHFGNEAVFHVTPLLSRSEIEPLRFETHAERYEAAAREALSKALDLESFRLARQQLRALPRWEAARGGFVEIDLRVPVRSSDLVVSLAELRDEGGDHCALLYSEYRAPAA